MKIVHHSYVTSCATVSLPPGLGDYLRGSIALGFLAQRHGFELRLDLSRHPARAFLRGGNLNQPPSQDVAEFLDERAHLVLDHVAQLKEDESSAVLTNFLPRPEMVTPKVLQLIRDQFQVDESIDGDANRLIESTVGRGFAIMHVRVADEHFEAGNMEFRLLNRYIKRKLIPKWGRQVLVLSNNAELKKSITAQFGLPLVETAAAHMGKGDASASHLRDTLIDYALISKASAVYSYSVYTWKSGFSRWCACLHDVPFEAIELVSPSERLIDFARRGMRRLKRISGF